MPERPYIYYDFTLSLCPECLRRVDAKIVFENSNVYMLKTCPDHGFHKVLMATDVEYYKSIRNYNKPSEMPLKFNTKTHYGCPYDCGLCTDHEQHSCLTIVEITDRCNLTCPTCYAMSSPHYGRHRTIEEIERMLDIIVANEGKPDVVQISGGEPTIHPNFFEILDIAKTKPIRHLMVNTNGIRIAKDKAFAERLASYIPDFEIYLQFDSFKPEALKTLRGKDLTEVRAKALENFNPATDRITLTDVRQKILEQTKIFQPNDLIPVPCNPDALVMGYALKLAGQVFPMTRYVDPAHLLNNSRNTIVYEQDEVLHRHMLKIFSTGISVDRVEENFKELLCCLPQIHAPGLSYENLFRIIIMRFIDAYDFDVRAIKKSCVHIVHKDGHIIPFETMNLFYRDEKQEYVKQLQKERENA